MSRHNNILYLFTFFLLSFFLSTTPVIAKNHKVLNFGIVPQQTAKKLATKWIPICEYLSQKTGYKIIFRTAPDIPTFEKRVSIGAYELAYMNPYHYTVFSKKPGYRAFAKQKGKAIQGIIVAKKDSKISDIKQLNEKTLAFPSPAAFAASILTRANLTAQNIIFTPKYAGSHDSVYEAISNGLYPAGGGVVRTFKNMESEVRDQLKIIFITKKYTPHAFAVHPSIPQETVDVVLSAMVSMRTNFEAFRLLKKINFNGIEAAHDKDWDDVRTLNIKILDNYN